MANKKERTHGGKERKKEKKRNNKQTNKPTFWRKKEETDSLWEGEGAALRNEGWTLCEKGWRRDSEKEWRLDALWEGVKAGQWERVKAGRFVRRGEGGTVRRSEGGTLCEKGWRRDSEKGWKRDSEKGWRFDALWEGMKAGQWEGVKAGRSVRRSEDDDPLTGGYRAALCSLSPFLTGRTVCSPNILRTVRRTIIRFLIELLLRRTWFRQFDELGFILNWLIMSFGPNLRQKRSRQHDSKM